MPINEIITSKIINVRLIYRFDSHVTYVILVAHRITRTCWREKDKDDNQVDATPPQHSKVKINSAFQ